jgi:hypothetical protein
VFVDKKKRRRHAGAFASCGSTKENCELILQAQLTRGKSQH